MLPRLDIWRSAIIRTPADRLQQSDLTAENILWLPETEERFTFRADPFGIWQGDKLHVFVERFDYRILKGEIELLMFDHELRLLSSSVVIREPWHLSYPFVFREGENIWMLPEASRSGRLTLYRASQFPFEWKPAAVLEIEPDAVDATPFLYQGRWWLVYGVVGQGRRSCALHLAFADRLGGPWRNHLQGPVRTGLVGTRPAGTPIIRGGAVEIPVQDSARSYGGAVRKLKILRLDESHCEAEDARWLEPSQALSPFDAGLHTVSAAGEISLIDCKRIERSLPGMLARRRGKLARGKRQRDGAEVRR